MAELSFKILGGEAVCNSTSASNMSTNTLIRITNIDTAPHLVNIAFANATIYANATVLANSVMYFQKAPTDILSSNAATAVVFQVAVRRGTT